MAFAQLTYRASLRDIEVCLRAQASKLYHMGIRAGVSRNTLANANQVRDWRLYADFAHHLIGEARSLYAGTGHGLELDNTVYALKYPLIFYRTANILLYSLCSASIAANSSSNGPNRSVGQFGICS